MRPPGRKTTDRRRLAALSLALLTALPACLGPESPLAVGVRKVPTDVRLGNRSGAEPQPQATDQQGSSTFPGLIQPPPSVVAAARNDRRRAGAAPGSRAQAPRSGANVPPGTRAAAPGGQNSQPGPGPGPGGTQPGPGDQAPGPPFKACTAAGAGAPRTEPPPERISVGPEPATYVFRNQGSFGTFRSSRTVQNVIRVPDGWTFDVVSQQTGANSTTSYQVVNRGGAPPPGGGLRDGLYITRMQNAARSFTAVPPLLLLPLPVRVGEEWDAEAVNPGTPVTMRYHGKVEGRSLVDACGTLIDAWEVRVTNGETTGVGQASTFDATYVIATQFGGLSVMDRVRNTEGGTTTQNLAIINEVPKPGRP